MAYLTPEMLALLNPKDPTKSMSDAELQQLAQTGVIPWQREDIGHQLALSTALRQNQPQYSGIGGLYGGLGNMLKDYLSGRMYRNSMDELAKTREQAAATGTMFGQHLRDAPDPLSQMLSLSNALKRPALAANNPFGLSDLTMESQ